MDQSLEVQKLMEPWERRMGRMGFTVRQRASHIQIWQKRQTCRANHWIIQLSQKITGSVQPNVYPPQEPTLRESWSTETAEGFNRTCRTISQGRHHRFPNRTRLQDIQYRVPRRFLGKDRYCRSRRPWRRDPDHSLCWR